MAQLFFTNFSTTPLGAGLPSGFTHRFSTPNTDPGADYDGDSIIELTPGGQRVLRCAYGGGAANVCISVDAAGTPTGAVEILMRLRNTNDTGRRFGPRLAVQTPDIDAILFAVAGYETDAVISQMVAGAQPAFFTGAFNAATAGTWFWMRARRESDGTTFRLRCWLDGSPEPGTWTVTATGLTDASTGRVGFGTTTDGMRTEIAVISVADGGDTASDTPPAAGATQLAFGTQPANTVQGVTMASFTVEARTSGGAVDTGYTGNITINLQVGSGTPTGTLTRAAVAGVATFNDIVISTVNTGAQFRATAAGLTLADSASFNITANTSATQLAFQVQPANTVVGQTMAAVTVRALNAGSAVDTSYTGNVTLALQTGSGTLAGTLTRAAVAGVATFNDLSLNTLNTNAVLRATASGLTQADSSTFNITAGASSATGGSRFASRLIQ